MAYLGIPQNTIAVLQKYNISFQKKFGQNFLIDTHVLEKIVAAADITRDDLVIEIGPGIGTLTQYLCEAAGEVLAIEIDRNLIPILENDTLKDYDNVTVINADVLKLDLAKIIEEHAPKRFTKVVANLPYYITTPIVMQVLESGAPVESMTVMVQKEVAERLQAKPGTPDYGAITLAVQYYTTPSIAANVPMNCFMPRPNVDSAVLCLKRHLKPQVEVKDEKLMFALIRASFNKRRKTLLNGLSTGDNINRTKEELLKAFEECGLSPSVRGETLGLSDFAALANALCEG
ncbi:MAG: 16S rRNA (adenine(1518)-N(6)/adenine(1519)-N(6))-dimethyltransferase RsmA [Lachnospiraceae bacterium]|nr:16S rRNA (adenine(1518)-N(6)/adenine(1519)-N(6))-dimethyltransferase RsmA [Lachnospiraceae bacterium]